MTLPAIFANQVVAANALLAQPLRVALEMKAPVNENTGAMTKLVTISALQSVLQAHANPAGHLSLLPHQLSITAAFCAR